MHAGGNRSGGPPAGNEDASNAWPRTGIGRSSTSESVRMLPIHDSAAMASGDDLAALLAAGPSAPAGRPRAGPPIGESEALTA